MKYYYGNDYKEAISNNPVEIKSLKVLHQYEECYFFVIPADEVEEDNKDEDDNEDLNWEEDEDI